MTFVIAIILWIGVPLLLVIGNLLRKEDLKLQIKHQQILYSFCSVRDSIALKVIRNEISEESAVFDFFYRVNACVIHKHPEYGKCFIKLYREIFKRSSEKPTAAGQRLAVEIEEADEELRSIVLVYVHACLKAVLVAMPYVLVDKLVNVLKATDTSVLSCLKRLPFFPKERKQLVELGLTLARAATA